MALRHACAVLVPTPTRARTHQSCVPAPAVGLVVMGSDFSPASTCAHKVHRTHSCQSLSSTVSMLIMRLLWQTHVPPFLCWHGILMEDTHSIRHVPPVAAQLHSSPYELCLCNQPESSPYVCPLIPQFQHPTTAHTSRRTSQAGMCGVVARTVYTGLSLPCGAAGQLLHSPLKPLKLLICPGITPSQWRRFPGWGNFSSFRPPSLGCRSHPNSSSSPFSLCPTICFPCK